MIRLPHQRGPVATARDAAEPPPLAGEGWGGVDLFDLEALASLSAACGFAEMAEIVAPARSRKRPRNKRNALAQRWRSARRFDFDPPPAPPSWGRGADAAFTLLELLLATVLLTVLMVGVLAVIGNLSRSSAVAAEPGRLPMENQIDALAAMLRQDLAGADRVEPTATGGLIIEGRIGLADDDRRATHRPARVTYRLLGVNGRPWLFRTEQALDESTNRNRRHDLVFRDAATITLTPTEPPPPPPEVEVEVEVDVEAEASEDGTSAEQAEAEAPPIPLAPPEPLPPVTLTLPEAAGRTVVVESAGRREQRAGRYAGAVRWDVAVTSAEPPARSFARTIVIR